MSNDLEYKNLLISAIEKHRQNSFQEAKDLYNEVLKINPENLDANNNLGIIYQILGETEKAIKFYNKAIEIKPNFADSHHNLKLIYFKIGDFENSYKHHVKFLEIKSSSIKTNSDLKKTIPKLAKKLQNQSHIPTFFDNAVVSQLISRNNGDNDFCDIFEKSLNSKDNRFVSYLNRIQNIEKSYSNNQIFGGLPFLASQGIHSLIKWKGVNLYKSTFDLTIYTMLLDELKPDYIIELGSGLGSSAVWMADTCNSLGLKTHVYSFDIIKPNLKHKNVSFIKQDINNLEEFSKLKFLKNINGKKIIIEDAHVNIDNVLNFFDKYLKKDDYLIIEDSSGKQKSIKKFTDLKDAKYKVDQFYLDFFGTNITSCVNSIFKCF